MTFNPFRSEFGFYGFLVILCGSLVTCGPKDSSRGEDLRNRTSIEPAPEYKAERKASRSFKVHTDDKDPSENTSQSDKGASDVWIAIEESALEKEFLFQSSIIDQIGVQSWAGRKSRIVRFKKVGSSLNMLEAPDGNSRTDALPAHLLLAQFPIIDIEDGWIRFDFATGMSRLLVAEDWYGSDLGSDYSPGLESLPVDASYIDKAVVDSEKLLIDQVALANGAESIQPVLLRTWITPYRPSPDYQPAPRSDFDRFGFFETAPRLPLHSGETIVHSTRFNPNKPIIFALSANTPDNYRQAVTDGILYWNRALGQELIKVVNAPPGATAPDFNYNIVQWIEDDDAGFAYADAQMDPRTGEILHAHVYMTSVFAFSGQESARSILKSLAQNPASNRQNGLQQNSIGLRGFPSSMRCSRPFADRIRNELTTALDQGADDVSILKASQDYVREVIAHEIGHTLGFRHNFAGSLGTNYEPVSRPQIQKDYFITQGRAPTGLVSSSSVMDYNAFLESIIAGDQISRQQPALDYDSAAAKLLYFGQSAGELSKPPLFCTDSHVDLEYLDCRLFDVGVNPITEADALRKESFQQTLTLLLDELSSHVAPPAGFKPKPIETFAWPFERIALSLLSPQSSVLSAFNGDAKLIQVERSYKHVSEIDQDQIAEESDTLLLNTVARFGGIADFLTPPTDDIAIRFAQELRSLIRTESYRNILKSDGTIRRLSDAELAHIDAYAKRIETELPIALRQVDLNLLSQFRNLRASALTSLTQSVYTARLETILLETDGDIQGSKTNESEPFNVPKFKYDFGTRLQGLELLSVSTQAPEWALSPANRLRVQIESYSETHLGVSLDEVQASEFSMPIARWILELQHLRNRLQEFEDSSVLAGL